MRGRVFFEQRMKKTQAVWSTKKGEEKENRGMLSRYKRQIMKVKVCVCLCREKKEGGLSVGERAERKIK